MAPAITDATDEHLPAIAAIYATAAEDSPATFDLEGPPLDWWRDVLASTDEAAGTHLLVALEGDEVVGYAKSGSFKDRGAYWTTREVSAYVHDDHRGKGVGGALYTELLRRLDATEGLRLAVGGVAQPNAASNRLHEAHNFTVAGTFEDVGEKLGRAWSVRWYQRRLAGGRGV